MTTQTLKNSHSANPESVALTIGKYSVTATFAGQKNSGAYEKVRQILLSSYANEAINRACDKLDTQTAM